MGTATIDEYLHLSIADCKRMGFLAPQAMRSGVVTRRVNDKKRASIGFATDTRGVPVAKFSYTCDGQPVDYTVYLRWKRSNLSPDTEHGYYYFVCPITGKLCRKLYLYDGRFVSRGAFNPLYKQQTKSHSYRNNPLFALLDLEIKIEQIETDRYRREYYNGKITPYGRKVAKTWRQLERYQRLFG